MNITEDQIQAIKEIGNKATKNEVLITLKKENK